jgi:hypothetical protein
LFINFAFVLDDLGFFSLCGTLLFVELLCVGNDISSALTHSGHIGHNAVLGSDSRRCGMDIDISCLFASEKLESERTENNASDKYCCILH